MRLRKKPWVSEALVDYQDIVVQPAFTCRGQWLKQHGGEALHIEIGTGRGNFITGMAERNPHILFVGIESSQDVLYDAAVKTREKQLTNVRLLVFNAEGLEVLFAPAEIDRLYLNFSDPWPKRRHAKRRLTHAAFLAKYQAVLAPGGCLWFKTDNEKLFEFSLNELAAYGLRLSDITFDLHHSDFRDNVMTEYEAKFAAKGKKIYRCEARFDQ